MRNSRQCCSTNLSNISNSSLESNSWSSRFNSNGKVVGTYLNASLDPYAHNVYNVEHVVISASGLSFAVQFTASQLGSDSAIVYFVSSDCTGTAYIQVLNSRPGTTTVTTPALLYTLDVGTFAYVGAGGATATDMNFNSDLEIINSVSVTCQTGSTSISNVVPVVATFDLSTLTFVPPFSVH